MTSTPVLVKRISQKDNHAFTIEWSDGKTVDYALYDLQKQCPCARCVDETTGKRVLDQRTVKNDVRAVRILSVGRYALRIDYTSGCSLGIYSFDMLRSLGS